MEYVGPCELSTIAGDFVAGTAHLIARGDIDMLGWYGFVESQTFDWEAVPPCQVVKVRLPSGSAGAITIEEHIRGTRMARVRGRGAPPW